MLKLIALLELLLNKMKLEIMVMSIYRSKIRKLRIFQ